MLELYHWEPNGSALKPLIVLHEKQLEFRSRYVDVLAFEQYGGMLADLARETAIPLEGEGPVLVHDGRQITESLFMIEYLEDAFAGIALRPAEPILQARILAWGRFINEVLMPAASTLGCRAYLTPALQHRDRRSLESSIAAVSVPYIREGWRAALAGDYPDELVEDSRRKVGLAIRRLEDTLSTTPWLVGKHYSLADIDAFAICNALPALVPELAGADVAPHVAQWLGRVRSRPAVRAALAMSRTGRPEQAFAPGPEHSRWG